MASPILRTGSGLLVAWLLAASWAPSVLAGQGLSGEGASHPVHEGPLLLYAQFGDAPEEGEAFLTPYPRLATDYTARGTAQEGTLLFTLFYPVHAAVAEANGRHFPDYRTQARWDLGFVPDAPVTAEWHVSVPSVQGRMAIAPLVHVGSELLAMDGDGREAVLASGGSSFTPSAQSPTDVVVRVPMGAPERGVEAEETLRLRLHWSVQLPLVADARIGAPLSVPLAGLTVHPDSRLELPMLGTSRVDGIKARSVMDEILVRGTVRHAFNAAFIDLANVSLAADGPASRGLVSSPMLRYERAGDAGAITGIEYEWRLPYGGASPEGLYEFTVRSAERGGDHGAWGRLTWRHGAEPSVLPGGPGALALLGTLGMALAGIGLMAWSARWLKPTN